MAQAFRCLERESSLGQKDDRRVVTALIRCDRLSFPGRQNLSMV